MSHPGEYKVFRSLRSPSGLRKSMLDAICELGNSRSLKNPGEGSCSRWSKGSRESYLELGAVSIRTGPGLVTAVPQHRGQCVLSMLPGWVRAWAARTLWPSAGEGNWRALYLPETQPGQSLDDAAGSVMVASAREVLWWGRRAVDKVQIPPEK